MYSTDIWKSAHVNVIIMGFSTSNCILVNIDQNPITTCKHYLARQERSNVFTYKYYYYKLLSQCNYYNECTHSAEPLPQVWFEKQLENDSVTTDKEIPSDNIWLVLPGQPLTRYVGRGSGQTCMLHSCLTRHSFCGVLTTG